ncbi:MAG: SDR family oxidoreductase [Candidatus Bathyarchaeota archaeon]|nr:MAG: SDR family oxidoreductase [Candidatus Bathyarchaeota archaeon]
MRVLVTGHKGYIGSVMVPILLNRGFDVVGLDNDLYEGAFFGDISLYGGVPCVPYLRKDIRDVEISDLNGIDSIIHLCALSNDPLGNFDPNITYEINCQASIKLAKLAKKAGVNRLIFTSSCSVYGIAKTDMVNEESEPNPITAYGTSKLRAEQAISALADSNFSPVFMRPATAYGVSPMLRFDLVLNNFVAWAYTSSIVLLKSTGTAFRPIVHIEDISRAFIAALTAPRDAVHNQVFNVGQTKENYIIRDLAQIAKETVPKSKIRYAKDASVDKRSYRVDFSKISSHIPTFKPKWNARSGAKQLYDAFKQYGLVLEDFEGPRYRRISHLENNVANGILDKDLRKVVYNCDK